MPKKPAWPEADLSRIAHQQIEPDDGNGIDVNQRGDPQIEAPRATTGNKTITIAIRR